MTNGGWSLVRNIAIAVGLAAAVASGIGSWYVNDYRLTRLEQDKRDVTALQQEDAELHKRIDTAGERISAQWRVVANIKERVVVLETQAGR